MKRLVRCLMMGAAFASLAAAAVQAQAQEAVPAPGHPHPHGHAYAALAAVPTLNLSAYGEARVAPDKATINFAVVTEGPTAAEAMRLNREHMTRVAAALRRQGVGDREVQTSGLNLQAVYDYSREGGTPTLRGYQAINQVTVTLYDLNRVGATVDAVVAAGVNQMHGVSFGLRDPMAAENQARLAAVRALQAKAELYAQATGHRLAGLRTLSEGGGFHMPPPPPVAYRMEAMAVTASAPTPIAPGELTVRVDVSGVYELARR